MSLGSDRWLIGLLMARASAATKKSIPLTSDFSFDPCFQALIRHEGEKKKPSSGGVYKLKQRKNTAVSL